MKKLFLSLFILLFLFSCNDDKKASSDPTLREQVIGTWVRNPTYTCDGHNWTDEGIVHKIKFESSKSVRRTEVYNICSGDRTGEWSIDDRAIVFGHASISCDSTNNCPVNYKINKGGVPESMPFNCPDDLRIDGQIFTFNLNGDTLILAPQTGPDVGCIYTYTR